MCFDASTKIARITDKMRQQLNIIFPQDKI